MSSEQKCPETIERSLEEIQSIIKNWYQKTLDSDESARGQINAHLKHINPIPLCLSSYEIWEKHNPEFLNVYFGMDKDDSDITYVIMIDSISDTQENIQKYIELVKIYAFKEGRQDSGGEVDIPEARARIQKWKNESLGWLKQATEIFTVMLVPFADLKEMFETQGLSMAYLHLAFRDSSIMNRIEPELILLDAEKAQQARAAMDVSTPVPPFPKNIRREDSQSPLPELYLLPIKH